MQKNKKVAAGIGVAALAAAALALGTGTYAAFQDTEAGPGGTLATGTLDLVVGGGASQAELFSATNIAPGYKSPTKTLTIKNDGTIDGVLSGTIKTEGSDNGCTDPEQKAGGCTKTEGDLPEALLVTISGTGVPGTVTVQANQLQGVLRNVPLGAGKDLKYDFVFELPQTTGNKVQSDSVTITSSVTLDQGN
nr:TasA family protein [Pseudonocardia acidicola]